MQRNEIRILSTGPLSNALKSEAAKYSIAIEEVSFINTEEIIDSGLERKIRELSHQNITAIFTSSNAVNMVGRFISPKPSWKIFCIANATERTVKKFFNEEFIVATAHYGGELAQKIIENSSVKRVTLFCGNQRRDELPVKLRSNGIEVEELIVYNTIEIPKALAKQYDGILFFSPSAVRSFFSKNQISGNTHIFAIGTTTANAVKAFTQQLVVIAESPGKGNLVSLAITYFSKNKTL